MNSRQNLMGVIELHSKKTCPPRHFYDMLEKAGCASSGHFWRGEDTSEQHQDSWRYCRQKDKFLCPNLTKQPLTCPSVSWAPWLSLTPFFCQRPVQGRTSYLWGLLWLTSFRWFINLSSSGHKMLVILVLRAHWGWLCPPGAWVAQCFLNALLLWVHCGVGSTAKVWAGRGLGLSPAGMWTLGTRLFSKCIQFVSD